MTERRHSFIAIHDYGHGAIAMRIYASDKLVLQTKLPSPTWTIYEENDPNRPNVGDEASLHTTDIDTPSELLQRHIFNSARRSEGKRPFFFRVHTEQGYLYREIWAKSEEDITARYPTFESMTLKPIGPEMMKNMGVSDLDVMDSFFEAHQ